MAASVFGKSSPKAPKVFTPPERGESDFGPSLNLRSVSAREQHPYDGKTFVITVKGPEEVKTKDYGVKTAIKANVLIAETGEVFTDQLLFAKAFVDALIGETGQEIIAGVGTYEAHGKRHVELVVPSDEQQAIANAALAADVKPPF